MEENLLIEYHQNLLDAANRKAVADWIAESSENQATYTQCVQIWQHAKEAAALQGLEVEADLQAVRQQLGISVAASPKRQSSMVWRIAALILLAIGLAWGGYQLSGPGAQPPMLSQETGDQPGAIFALADGSQIRLNAHSRLRYPAKFTGNRRQLELEGEAWFHVKADKAHPFVIHHQNSQTEVLGTQFEIRAYPAEPAVQVTVFEGVVRLASTSDAQRNITLTQGQTGQFQRTATAPHLQEQPNQNQSAWRTGKLQFSETLLPEVLATLEKHYQFEIIVKESENYQKCLFSGSFDELSIEPVLKTLALVFGAKYTIDGNEITILHINC